MATFGPKKLDVARGDEKLIITFIQPNLAGYT